MDARRVSCARELHTQESSPVLREHSRVYVWAPRLFLLDATGGQGAFGRTAAHERDINPSRCYFPEVAGVCVCVSLQYVIQPLADDLTMIPTMAFAVR